MKKVFSNLFRWNPTRETLIAFLMGLTVLVLSLLMIPSKSIPWLQILIRDIIMIFFIGIVYPIYYISKSPASSQEYGLTRKRWYIFLILDLIFGFFLLLMFLSESPLPTNFIFNSLMATKIFYIMLAGIFEVIFFYSFLRTLFERAFGILPAIIFTAIFYTFHHIGFQPEFTKLFFVGILYAVVFRLGNSVLLIYPFFWGVGACYDVFIQSQEISPLKFAGIRGLYLSFLLVIFIGWMLKKHITSNNGVLTT